MAYVDGDGEGGIGRGEKVEGNNAGLWIGMRL